MKYKLLLLEVILTVLLTVQASFAPIIPPVNPITNPTTPPLVDPLTPLFQSINGVEICSSEHLCSSIQDNFCPEYFAGNVEGICNPDDFDCCNDEWNLPGEASSAGIDSSNLCCGNEPGEFSTNSQYDAVLSITESTKACCSSSFSCVDNGVCYSNASLIDVTNDVYVEMCDENIWKPFNNSILCESLGCTSDPSGCICGYVITLNVKEQPPGTAGRSDVDFIPSANAIIKVYENIDLRTPLTVMQTSSNGNAILNVINGDYTVSIEKERYSTESRRTTISNADMDIGEINLFLSDDCQNDYTRNDGICHSECYGEIGYDESIIGSGAYEGVSLPQACDRRRSSWVVEGFSADASGNAFDLICCGRFSESSEITVEIRNETIIPHREPISETPANTALPNIETTCRVILLPSGQPTTMCISVWD